MEYSSTPSLDHPYSRVTFNFVLIVSFVYTHGRCLTCEGIESRVDSDCRYYPFSRSGVNSLLHSLCRSLSDSL